RRVVPIGQRDQSAAALPIRGGVLTATARFAPRVVAVLVTRVVVVVVVTRVAFFVFCIENGCNLVSVFEILITSTSSLSETVLARLTFSARRSAGPAACNSRPSPSRAPYFV